MRDAHRGSTGALAPAVDPICIHRTAGVLQVPQREREERRRAALEAEPGTAEEVGLRVCCSPDGAEETRIAFQPAAGTWTRHPWFLPRNQGCGLPHDRAEQGDGHEHCEYADDGEHAADAPQARAHAPHRPHAYVPAGEHGTAVESSRMIGPAVVYAAHSSSSHWFVLLVVVGGNHTGLPLPWFFLLMVV